MLQSLKYVGNKQLLENYKIAFLCSRKCPADIILKSYDWAIEQREKDVCVISGFHSKIEKDVLRSLLKDYRDMIARIIAEVLEIEEKVNTVKPLHEKGLKMNSL